MRSPEVCALTGASYRQLDHWVTLGYVVPSITDQNGALAGDGGTGYPREFTADDVLQVAVMVELVTAGMRPDAAAALARGVREFNLPTISISVDVVLLRGRIAARMQPGVAA